MLTELALKTRSHNLFDNKIIALYGWIAVALIIGCHNSN